MASHLVSLYEIENLTQLKARYRLVEIDGAFGCERDDEDLAEKNLNLLLKQLSFQEHVPAALVKRGGQRLIAVPADAKLEQTEYALTPHIVSLRALPGTYDIDFDSFNAESERVGLAFLAFQLRTPLMNNTSLWRSGPSSYFSKRPVNWEDEARDVDVYGGFTFRLVRHAGKIYLALQLSYRYVDNAWLVDRCETTDIRGFRMRYLLYHFGDRWFPVQLLGATGGSITQARFQPDGGGAHTNVYDYTLQKCGQSPPNWVRTLRPDSPAILFRYPGKDKRLNGAAALAKLMLANSDHGVQAIHRKSIVPPSRRFERMAALVARHFQSATFGGTPVRIRDRSLRVEPKVFSVPSFLFGGGRVLKVKSRPQDDGVPLAQLGHSRMSLLLDPEVGLAVATGFAAEHIIIPQELPRPIVQDFQTRVEKTVRQMAQTPFTLQSLLYEDSGKRTLAQQVDAITGALDRAGVDQGHALLVLPENAREGLHDHIKREILDRLQVQCANAGKIKSFYRMVPRQGKADYVVREEAERQYASYIRYLALGLLIVNRQWPWVLEQGTNYDVYIGVDVLHNTAAFTFFYEGGRRCFVRTRQSKQKERLLRGQIKSIIYECLKEDLADCFRPPRCIIIHRDGRTFECEWRGFQDAVGQLIREGLLPSNVIIGVVEIHKHSTTGLRLAEEDREGPCNPPVGSWFPVDDCEGIVCTTGQPFKFQGTVNPLSVRIARGNLDLCQVLQDIFSMSQLCWMVPDRCIRLPMDVKLCDEFLRSVASEADDEELYDEEGLENGDQHGSPDSRHAEEMNP